MFITIEVPGRTQKIEIYLANGRFCILIFSTTLRHFFRSIADFEFGLVLRTKGPHKPDFAYDIVRIHSILIYTDLSKFNIVGDTNAPTAALHPFYSKAQSWSQYKYWTVDELSNL